jgi:hypothetical protein
MGLQRMSSIEVQRVKEWIHSMGKGRIVAKSQRQKRTWFKREKGKKKLAKTYLAQRVSEKE